MTTALILSSYVAASRIGGVVQQLAFARLGIDPVLIPAALFGRSPALGGKPQPTPPEAFRTLLEEVEAHGVFDAAEVVITGHFSSAEQVEIAAQSLERLRHASPGVRVVVDPVMGDAPKGLYVKLEVAQALARRLIPLADWITPNAWELERLSGIPILDAGSVLAASRSLDKAVLATSTPAEPGEIGLVCCDGHASRLYAHALASEAPHGVGDLVTAVFAAGLVERLSPQAAAEWAARAVVRAVAAGTPDLPLAALSASLMAPGAELRIEAVP